MNILIGVMRYNVINGLGFNSKLFEMPFIRGKLE